MSSIHLCSKTGESVIEYYDKEIDLIIYERSGE